MARVVGRRLSLPCRGWSMAAAEHSNLTADKCTREGAGAARSPPDALAPAGRRLQLGCAHVARAVVSGGRALSPARTTSEEPLSLLGEKFLFKGIRTHEEAEGTTRERGAERQPSGGTHTCLAPCPFVRPFLPVVPPLVGVARPARRPGLRRDLCEPQPGPPPPADASHPTRAT